MTRFRSIERMAYRLALLLGLAAAGRFGWVLARHGANHLTAERPRETSHPSVPSLADLQRQLAVPVPNVPSLDSAIAEAVGSAKSAPAPPARDFIKSYLSVQAGPARSEVRVDGLLVGRTPYVGQIGCERGKTVKIDLLPPTGMPKHYQVPCLEGEMTLRDEP
jgi:hypothetical protein